MATVTRKPVTTALSPDRCLTFPGVGWEGLQHAKMRSGESQFRITYANGDLMLISPGFSHEAYRFAISDLVRAVARTSRIKTRSLGSTYWERQGVDAGKEPDASYYVAYATKFGRRTTTTRG